MSEFYNRNRFHSFLKGLNAITETGNYRKFNYFIRTIYSFPPYLIAHINHKLEFLSSIYFKQKKSEIHY